MTNLQQVYVCPCGSSPPSEPVAYDLKTNPIDTTGRGAESSNNSELQSFCTCLRGHQCRHGLERTFCFCGEGQTTNDTMKRTYQSSQARGIYLALPTRGIRLSLIVALCCVIFTCCGPKVDNSNSESASRTAAPDTVPVVKTTTVTSKLLSRELLLPGEILPYQDVPLYPKIPGFIKWIGVDRGYYVKKGQLLVQMIAPEVEANRDEAEAKQQQALANIDTATRKLQSSRAALARAQAKLKSLQDTYDRMKKAAEVPGVISGNELEVYRQNVEAQRAEVDSCGDLVEAAAAELAAAKQSSLAAKQAVSHVKDLLQYLKITAPYDGMITERNMHEGSFAYPLHGQDGYPPMLRIKQLSLLRVVIPVPEYAVDGVDIGTRITFTVSAYPNRQFVGEVARIAHSLDTRTRTEPVELNYWNNDRAVDPGMFPEIHWPMKRSYKTLFVPVSAVHTSLETPIVVRIRDNKVQWVKVRRGQLMDDKIEVFGDLQAGDTIALKGTDDIPEGTLVKAEPSNPDALSQSDE